MFIRAMSPDDAPAVIAIFADGIASHNATLETAPGTWAGWDSAHLPACRLVAEQKGEVAAWAALSSVSSRTVYRGVAEVSLYVGARHRGAGLGKALMAALVESSEAEGFWTLQAGIFPQNAASLRLHRRFGFREVGRRKGLGQMQTGPLAGQWRDVVLMERRSKVVGAD